MVASTSVQAQQSAAVRPACNWGDARLPQRFWDKVSPCPMSGCWIWTGRSTQSKHSDHLTPMGTGGCTRRVAYLALMPSSRQPRRLLASCGVDLCCNPLHAIESLDREGQQLYNKNFHKQWTARNRERVRVGHRARRHGLTPADIDRIRDQQCGLCAICTVKLEPPVRRNSRYRENIDHCHSTLKIRGLLCFSCNCALGHFSDRPDLLRAAADYLERHAAKAAK